MCVVGSSQANTMRQWSRKFDSAGGADDRLCAVRVDDLQFRESLASLAGEMRDALVERLAQEYFSAICASLVGAFGASRLLPKFLKVEAKVSDFLTLNVVCPNAEAVKQLELGCFLIQRIGGKGPQQAGRSQDGRVVRFSVQRDVRLQKP